MELGARSAQNFRPKSTIFAWVLIILCAILATIQLVWFLAEENFWGAATTFLGYGFLCWILWVLFVHPHVQILNSGVFIINPLTTTWISYKLLIHIDTKYNLTLHTPETKNRAWSVSSPGPVRTQMASPSDVEGHPDISYLNKSVQPGQLKLTHSGTVYSTLVTSWQEYVEADADTFDSDSHVPNYQKKYNTGIIAVTVGLLVALSVCVVISAQ